MIESQFIPQLITQGANLAVQEINHPLLKIRPLWPKEEIVSLPLNFQCEEVEWKENKLISIKKLVMEAEII